MSIRSSLCTAAMLTLVVFSNSSALEMSAGVKCGLNLTKFYTTEKLIGLDKFSNNVVKYDLDDFQVIKPGFTIGAALQLKLNMTFAIQPEILLSAKGQKLVFNNYTQIISINYLEIPVLFELLIPVGIITPTLYAGPSFAFKIGKVNGRDEFDGEGEDWTYEMRDYTDKYVNGFDFGIAMGGGIAVKAGPGNFIIDARYTLGLTKIFKLTDDMKADGTTEADIKNTNSALSFCAGYLFSF